MAVELLKDVAPGIPISRNAQMKTVQLLIKLGLNLKITGMEHIPATGSAVIVINHIDFLDPVIVLGLAPRVITPMAKAEVLQSWLWGPFVSSYGSIPVHRDEGDMKALKTALRILKHGGAVFIAPEGTRSPTYQMQPAKDGAAILALRSEAQIVPIGITGTHQTRLYWTKFKRAPVQISVGKPFRLQSSSGHGKLSRQEIAAMTEQIMYRLAKLLPPEYRGVYGDIELLTDKYLVPGDG